MTKYKTDRFGTAINCMDGRVQTVDNNWETYEVGWEREHSYKRVR
ncbi:hypothetical protein ACFLR7_07095 [Acidobacteriota bacterium]